MAQRIDHPGDLPVPPPSAKPTEPPPTARSPRNRFAFIDWYRGLACVLMFQTHAYDAWLAEPQRGGFAFWLSRMQLGGFPSRLFLLLAGVSLALRCEADDRRGTPPRTAQHKAARRGLEVLLLGYLFRASEWLLAGAHLAQLEDLLRVDILNCIGASLILAAYLCSPRDLQRRSAPLRLFALSTALAFAAPLLEPLLFPPWLPRPLTAYLWGPRPLASFPLVPWFAYVLAGTAVGLYWMQAKRAGALRRAMVVTALAGLALAVAGQLGSHANLVLFPPRPGIPYPATPIAWSYRTGMCLLGAAGAYSLSGWIDRVRFSPLRLLGQASMLVYWVHIEIVYGRLSGRIQHRLSWATASAMLALLTALMIGLAFLRVEIAPRARRARAGKAHPEQG